MFLKQAGAWLRGPHWRGSVRLPWAAAGALVVCVLVATWLSRGLVSSSGKNPSEGSQQLSNDLVGTLGNPRGSITDKIGIVRELADAGPEAPLRGRGRELGVRLHFAFYQIVK